MISTQGNSIYCSYLVRLWPEDKNWRATAENVHNGERHAFGDLKALFDFLEQQTNEMTESVQAHND